MKYGKPGRAQRPPFFIAIIILMMIGFNFGCSSTEKKTPSADPTDKNYIGPYPKPYKVLGKWYQPLPHAKGFKETGLASWYGEDFHGKPTASGEIYDMHKISAAHKTLPLGTYVRVINFDNNRTIDVRINDRGPFVDGRVIDLSYAAAKKLRIIGPGTAQVKIIALGAAQKTDTEFGKVRTYTPVNYYRGKFRIQVAAFKEKSNAERLLQNLEKSYKYTTLSTFHSHDTGETLYRVLVGKCHNLETAEKYRMVLESHGFKKAFIIAE